MEGTNSASKVASKLHLVRNTILQPFTLGNKFTHEHGLMDDLSFIIKGKRIKSLVQKGYEGKYVSWNKIKVARFDTLTPVII